MAKASTDMTIAKKTRSGAPKLPAGKKGAAAKVTKAAVAGRVAAVASPARAVSPKQASAKQSARKQPTAKRPTVRKQSPVQMAAARKTAKGAPQKGAGRQVAQPAATANKTARAALTPKKTAGAGSGAGGPGAVRIAPRRASAKAAAPPPAARGARPAVPPKRPQPPSRPASARPPQSFTVSHLNETDFKPDGLRSYAQYRDLGIAAATSGLCQAHVIRFTPPCTDAVRKRHRHGVDLQLVYVLKGWMKNEFAGVGEQMMSTGSCWLQPSGVEHTVLDYSADCEVLEVIVPADFKTDELG